MVARGGGEQGRTRELLLLGVEFLSGLLENVLKLAFSNTHLGE